MKILGILFILWSLQLFIIGIFMGIGQLNKDLGVSGYRNFIFRTLNNLIYHEYFNRESRLSPSELNKILLETLNYKGYEQFLNDLLDNIRDFQEYGLNKTVDRTFIYFQYPINIDNK